MKPLTQRRVIQGIPGAMIIAVIFMFLMVPTAYPGDSKVLFREDFNNLENWRIVHFPKVPKHTAYTVETKGVESFLKAESKASASALVYKQEFNVYQYSRARWKWKVDNLYQNASPDKKSGDDYPIRVYINFKYDPETADALDKVKYGLAKKLFGEYPPHSSLTYVWANSEGQKPIVTNPYTDRAKVIALEKGNKNTGIWQYGEANILQDYKRAFGVDPPAVASISIMNDSDDTGQASVSYVDFIEVFGDAG
jgi:hypothetical protein